MDAALEASTMRKVYLRLLPFAVLSLRPRLHRPHQRQLRRADHARRPPDVGRPISGSRSAPSTGPISCSRCRATSSWKRSARGMWIARIMITWGIFAGATAFVTGTTSFAIVRFLLGVAEAGFFPGMMLYFTYWFPRPAPCPHRLGLPGRPADRGGARRADLDRRCWAWTACSASGLADHVHRRGDPDGRDRHRDATSS